MKWIKMSNKEIIRQIEEVYKEREKLFRNPEDIVAKVRINEQYRYVFPELAKDLEQHGQRVPVYITEDGIIKDGIKRTLLAVNPSELKTEIVEDDAFIENMPLTRKQRNIVIKFAYDNIIKTGKYTNREVVEKLSKRYGLSTRQIENIIYGHEKISLPSNKPMEKKLKGKCNVCDYPRQVQNLNEELARIREQYNKAISNIEEVVASDEFRLSRAISLFLQKHPNKEFRSDGIIQDKITE
jgi:hypothetical protein